VHNEDNISGVAHKDLLQLMEKRISVPMALASNGGTAFPICN
jgi:hypothetical protein